ncbi:MAG: tetratricopeptide repeat protein [Planctomycetota bacterium]|jgi:4-amino-4-deoxy-L-arabinose transferase-like glycosyltransferase
MTARALLVVALVALLARAGYEAAMIGDEGPVASPVSAMAAHLMGDERAYDRFARNVADGTLDRERSFYQEPLYAWTVGQLYKVFPPAPVDDAISAVARSGVHVGIVVVQHLLGVLTALLVAALGARCLGARVGLLAGLFAALSGPAIFHESMLLKEACALTLWVASLHLWLDVLDDRGRRRALLLGLALGLGVLLRGNTYFLLAAVTLSLLLRVNGRRRPAAIPVVLVAALVVLSPATIHNLRRGEFVLSTYQSGTNAAIGQPDTDDLWRGVGYEPVRAAQGDALHEEGDAIAVAEAAEGRRLSGPEISAWWWRETARRVGERPGTAAARVGLKLAHVFHGEEIPDVKDWAFFRRAVPWLGTPLSDLTWLGPLGLAGLLFLPWRRRESARQLAVVRSSVGVVALTLMLFYVMGRYRLSAAPGLWILAAGALDAGWRTLSGGAALARKAGVVALGVGVVALGQVPLLSSLGDHVSFNNLASVELSRARTADSAAEAERFRDRAVDAARTALGEAPAFPAARMMLIRALDLRTPLVEPRAEEAWVESWRLMLVMECERTGQGAIDVLDRDVSAVASAVQSLRALPSRPGMDVYVGSTLAYACRRVAQDLRAPEQWPMALELVETSLTMDPAEVVAWVQRGLILKRMGRLDEAEQAYRKAIELGEDSVEVHNNLGSLLLSSGRCAEAARSFELALARDPDNAKVADNLRRARACP